MSEEFRPIRGMPVMTICEGLLKFFQITLVVAVPILILTPHDLHVNAKATGGALRNKNGLLSEKSIFCHLSEQTGAAPDDISDFLKMGKNKRPNQELIQVAICSTKAKNNDDAVAAECFCVPNWQLVATVICSVVTLLFCIVDGILFLNSLFVYDEQPLKKYFYYSFCVLFVHIVVWCTLSVANAAFLETGWPYVYEDGEKVRQIYYEQPICWKVAVFVCFFFCVTIMGQAFLHFLKLFRMQKEDIQKNNECTTNMHRGNMQNSFTMETDDECISLRMSTNSHATIATAKNKRENENGVNTNASTITKVTVDSTKNDL